MRYPPFFDPFKNSLYFRLSPQTSTYKDLYKEALMSVYQSSSSRRIVSDEELRNLKFYLRQSDINSVLSHNDKYDIFLFSYADFISRTLKSKRRMKNIFFFIAIGLILLVTFIMLYGLNALFCDIQNNSLDYKKYILEVISALFPFISTLMVIPKIIAKYLFNSNEETTANKIVKNIQNYDNKIREREEKRDEKQNQEQELEE